jgi:hypothetical protein
MASVILFALHIRRSSTPASSAFSDRIHHGQEIVGRIVDNLGGVVTVQNIGGATGLRATIRIPAAIP